MGDSTESNFHSVKHEKNFLDFMGSGTFSSCRAKRQKLLKTYIKLLPGKNFYLWRTEGERGRNIKPRMLKPEEYQETREDLKSYAEELLCKL